MLVHTVRTFAFTASTLAFMAGAAIAGQAHAADADTQTSLVHYQDLNLATDTGEARLQARVARAAAKVCGSDDGRRTLDDQERFDTCRNNAIATASPQVNAVIASVRSSDHRYAMSHDAIAMLGR